MNPFMITGGLSGIVLFDALCILRRAISLKRQRRPYTTKWCYQYLQRGMRLLSYLQTLISIFSFQVAFFLPQTFMGSNAMRHTSAWYGGTSLLLGLASYGLSRWLVRLLMVVSLSVYTTAFSEEECH